MNRYIFLQRIQGPALLLTFGVCALLDQWDILSFGRSWPLFLIVLGVIKLAQRTALATAEPPPYPNQYPGGYPGYASANAAPVQTAPASTSLVPSEPGSITNDPGDRR